MEEWIRIKGFEDYEVSNLGRVKSYKYHDVRIMTSSVNNRGYCTINLSSKGVRKTYKVHQLVAMAFLEHTPCKMGIVIDHIDFDKQNNKLSNIRVVSFRENISNKQIKKTSQFKGVYWSKCKNKWCAQICINWKNKYLGSFHSEIEAHNAYQKALSNHLAL